MKRTKTNSKSSTTTLSESRVENKYAINKYLIEYFPVIFIALGFVIFGSIGLGKFFTTDETAWFYTWVRQYWEAMSSLNFSDIPNTTYPGALHSFLVGLVDIFLDISNYLRYDKVETYLFWWRFPILLFNGIFLIIIYNLLRYFFDKIQSTTIIFLLAVTPVLLGMSRIVNSDSLLWSTSLISVLSFQIFTEKKDNKHLLIAAIFMGLALASKYNAVVIFIYQLLIIPLQFLFEKVDKKSLKELFLKMILIWLIAIVVFTFLYPVAIVNPDQYWRRIFRHFISNPLFVFSILILILDIFLLKNRILTFIKDKLDIKYYLIKILPILFLLSILSAFLLKEFNIEPSSWQASFEQWKMPFSKSLAENFYGFFYSVQIPILLGITILAVVSLIRKKSDIDFTVPLYMIIFILIFILGSSIQGVKTGHRYIIIILPFSTILAVWAYSTIKKYKNYIFIFAVILSTVDIALLYPQSYFLYRNTNYFPEQTKYFWSLGTYETAQELNKLDGAENLFVLCDRPGFSLFFKGKSELITGMITGDYIKQFDYLYLSESGYINNYIIQPLEDYYEMPKDKYFTYIGNENIGWAGIVKVDKNKPILSIENAFDTKFYIDLEKDWSISLWTQQFEDNPGHILYIGKNYKSGIEFFMQNNSFVVKYSENEEFKINNIDSTKLNNIIWTHKNIGGKQVVSLWLNGSKILQKNISISKVRKPKFFIYNNYKGKIEDVRIFNFIVNSEQSKLIFKNGIGTDNVYKLKGNEFTHVRRFSKQN